MSNPDFAIRAYDPATDEGFVMSSFLRGLRESPGTSVVENAVFFRFFQAAMANILASATTLVAHVPGQPTDLCGYVVFAPTPDRLFWVYTKRAFRRLGCARYLFEASGLSKDLLTPFKPQPWVRDIAKAHGITVRVNPYLMISYSAGRS